MTSKEFNRKIEFYRDFSRASDLFYNPEVGESIGWIWKVCCIGVDGETFIDFISSINQRMIDWYQSFFELRSIYYDRFTFAEFKIQMRYFKSFVAKTSEYQYAVLQQDSQMCKLLDYIKGFDI